jgi:hypothetical protein
MEIPIGKNYTFTIKVLEPDSFLPLDVTGYTGTFSVFKQVDDTQVISPISLIPVVGDEANGLMKGTVSGSATSGIDISKGEPADGYYTRVKHAGFMSIVKNGEPDVNVSIDRIRFVPTGL